MQDSKVRGVLAMNDVSVKENGPSARAELKVILDHFGAYKKDFVMSGLCVFTESLLELMIPVLMAQIVDQGILQGNLQTVFVNGIVMVVLLFSPCLLVLAMRATQQKQLWDWVLN